MPCNTEANRLADSPKRLCKQLERDLLKEDWEQVETESAVKLHPSPEDGNETLVF